MGEFEGGVGRLTSQAQVASRKSMSGGSTITTDSCMYRDVSMYRCDLGWGWGWGWGGVMRSLSVVGFREQSREISGTPTRGAQPEQEQEPEPAPEPAPRTAATPPRYGAIEPCQSARRGFTSGFFRGTNKAQTKRTSTGPYDGWARRLRVMFMTRLTRPNV